MIGSVASYGIRFDWQALEKFLAIAVESGARNACHLCCI
jgi:hypothetical protein